MGFIAKIIIFPFKFLKWLILWLVGVLALTAIFATPVEGISLEQQGAISQHCSTIKQSLNQLQKNDSRTRTYLGTTYEMIATKFIRPLNLRLVNNNRPILASIQSDFTNGQTKFREAYTEYMRELEGLIAIDCRVHPDEFYQKLTTVREKRANLRTATNNLNKLATDQYDAVVKLRSTL